MSMAEEKVQYRDKQNGAESEKFAFERSFDIKKVWSGINIEPELRVTNWWRSQVRDEILLEDRKCSRRHKA